MTARAATGSGRPARSPRELVPRLGRALLWLAVAVLLVRGVTATLASRRTEALPRVSAARAVWPDDAARAFAVEFATGYLEQPPAGAATGSGLAELVVPELAGQLALRSDDRRRRPLLVRAATPAGAVRLDVRHALITVAAVVGDTPARTLRVTVPVARDARGAVVVYDLPSLAAAPGRATEAPPIGDPLVDGDERAAITDVLTRFLRAYLAGDRAGLSYLVPAGTRFGAVAGWFELVDVRSLAAVGPGSGAVRRVLVTVDVRDRVSRAVMALRYRARLVRRDRWYVAELNTAGSGTR